MERASPHHARGRRADFGQRVAKAARLEPVLDARLNADVRARNVSANLLINRAVAEFLDRLLPVDDALKTA
jgi:hypothetical protein